jgi:hypothetical protein
MRISPGQSSSSPSRHQSFSSTVSPATNPACDSGGIITGGYTLTRRRIRQSGFGSRRVAHAGEYRTRLAPAQASAGHDACIRVTIAAAMATSRMPDAFPVLDVGEYVLRRIELSDAADWHRYLSILRSRS